MDLGGSTKGGKKPLDAAINLVPFIDLMAVMISFLIMTAVWNQIGRIPIAQSGAAMESTATPEAPVTLLITQTSLALTVGGSAFEVIPLVRDAKGRLGLQKLRGQIEELHVARPEQRSITLQTDDAVRYEDLVRIIDACIGAGLSSVRVST